MVGHADQETCCLERRCALHVLGGVFLVALIPSVIGLSEAARSPRNADQDIVIVGNWVMLKQDLL